MPDQLALELMADMAELQRLHDAIDNFGDANHWSPQSIFQVKLALEEVVVNTLSYGFNGHADQRIVLKLVQQDQHVTIEIADNGVAFNPLEQLPPDLDASLEDRAVGGLGVYLVRQVMDSVSYRREGAWNRLSLTKAVR